MLSTKEKYKLLLLLFLLEWLSCGYENKLWLVLNLSTPGCYVGYRCRVYSVYLPRLPNGDLLENRQLITITHNNTWQLLFKYVLLFVHKCTLISSIKIVFSSMYIHNIIQCVYHVRNTLRSLYNITHKT